MVVLPSKIQIDAPGPPVLIHIEVFRPRLEGHVGRVQDDEVLRHVGRDLLGPRRVDEEHALALVCGVCGVCVCVCM